MWTDQKKDWILIHNFKRSGLRGDGKSGVENVKCRLIRVTGKASFTYEDSSTVLCQIKAYLNTQILILIRSSPTISCL